jgi:hypothetical protein
MDRSRLTPLSAEEAHYLMTEQETPTNSLDILEDVVPDCRALYLNRLIAKFIDQVHDHAAKISDLDGLEDTLTMLAALRRELLQMRRGNPASNAKPWLKWEQQFPKLDHTNIGSAVNDGLEDLNWAVITEEDDDEQCDMAVIYIRALTDQILHVSNEIADRAWGVDIVKDTVIEQLGYWPEDEDGDPTPTPITEHESGQQH